MATNNDRQAAEAIEFWKKLDAMVIAATNTKKYDAIRTRVVAVHALLEEEERATATLAEEACVTVALIEPPLPTPSPAPTSCAAPSDEDYEVVVIANIHVQTTSMQNIHSLVSVTLDLSSMNYGWWHGNVRLTLGRYSLFDHMLLDTTYVGILAWDQMDSVIKSWIWCTTL
jgi:hypothetical protein